MVIFVLEFCRIIAGIAMKIRVRFKALGLNILILLSVAVLLVGGTFWWLDRYTRHGESVEVPDVMNLFYADADILLTEHDMYATVVDSVYIDEQPRGVVVDQVPRAGSSVKRGRTIYLTVNAFSPRRIPIPKLDDLSYRQAQEVLKSLGFPKPRIIYEDSEYKDLVLRVLVDGEPVDAEERYAEDTRLTLVVGNGRFLPARRKVISAAEDSTETDAVELSDSDLLDL